MVFSFFFFYLITIFVHCEGDITTNQAIGSELFSIYSAKEAPDSLKIILQNVNISCASMTQDEIETIAASISACQFPNLTDCSQTANRKGQSVVRCSFSSSEDQALMLGKFVYQVEMLCEYYAYVNISTFDKLFMTGFFNETREIWIWLKSTYFGKAILSQFFYLKDFTAVFESTRLTAYIVYITFAFLTKFKFGKIEFLSNGTFNLIIEITTTTFLSFFDVTKPNGTYLISLIIRYVWLARIAWHLFIMKKAEHFCSYFEEKKRSLRKK